MISLFNYLMLFYNYSFKHDDVLNHSRRVFLWESTLASNNSNKDRLTLGNVVLVTLFALVHCTLGLKIFFLELFLVVSVVPIWVYVRDVFNSFEAATRKTNTKFSNAKSLKAIFMLLSRTLRTIYLWKCPVVPYNSLLFLVLESPRCHCSNRVLRKQNILYSKYRVVYTDIRLQRCNLL